MHETVDVITDCIQSYCQYMKERDRERFIRERAAVAVAEIAAVKVKARRIVSGNHLLFSDPAMTMRERGRERGGPAPKPSQDVF